VIKGKYGSHSVGRVVMGEECSPWFSSTWWRDVCSIGVNIDHNWFAQGVVKRMGNGEHARFRMIFGLELRRSVINSRGCFQYRFKRRIQWLMCGI
jgi:hypothetical protein